MGIGMLARTDVHHHEVLYQFWPLLCEGHGGLSTHGMPHKDDLLQPKLLHERMHVRRHDRVRDRGGMWRAPMIAQVDKEHIQPRRTRYRRFSEFSAHTAPVVRCTEESMQDHHRRGTGSSRSAVKEFN